MYTALERGRTYYIGPPAEAKAFIFLGREFPDDHPAVFKFVDAENGEILSLALPHLTELESKGSLRYGGIQHL